MDHPINPLLGPVIALAAWTIVMLFWAVGKGVGAARRNGLKDIPAKGTRVRDLEASLPPEASWARHNYEHLVEQPTLFYAIVLALALMGDAHPINLALAWGYVGLRIVHSIYQATVNVGRVRGLIFVASTLCLIALILHAALAFLHHA